MAYYSTSLKRIYGASADAVRDNLVPFTFTFPNDKGEPQKRVVYVNKHVMKARLELANDALIKSGVRYTLHSLGCFNWRKISGSLLMSMHSGAIAVDINPATNPMKYGKLVTDMPAAFVKAFTDAGFTWGGTWLRKDAMHFELRLHTEPVKPPAVKPKPVKTVANCHALNFRIVPNGAVLTSLHAGAKVTVLGTKGAWSRVSYNGRVGWVASRYLKG